MPAKSRFLSWAACSLLALAAASATAETGAASTAKKEARMTMQLTSESFESNGMMPARHTCEGKGTSPQLAWTGVPENAKSLVLIVDDPDAPKKTWVHWVLYNIPADSKGLEQGIGAKELPSGTLQGKNDWKRTGYGAPCPPSGKHRYFFKLYALDATLPDLKTPSKADVEKAMTGHVLAQTELIGLYQKQK